MLWQRRQSISCITHGKKNALCIGRKLAIELPCPRNDAAMRVKKTKVKTLRYIIIARKIHENT